MSELRENSTARSPACRPKSKVASTERAPRTIAERYAEAEAELRACEQVFRQWGLRVSAGHPGETEHLQRQAVIGACMVVGADKLLKVERDRIAAAGEGLTAVDKAKRLADLDRAILRTAAKRELLLRDREAPGEFLPREPHAELAVFRRDAVEHLAR